jgi:modulator of FtsH protease HflK
MAHKHGHIHEHDHGHNRVHLGSSDQEPYDVTKFDAAEKSLSEALGLSFVILKVVMIVLVLAFLASGFKTVGNDEQALVLRFGAVRGHTQEGRVLGPGWHWVLPYPIDEVVKIPVAKQTDLAVTSFWYKENRDDIIGQGARPKRPVPPKLNPLREGYCLTGSQKTRTRRAAAGLDGASLAADVAAETSGGLGTDGSDYSIVHMEWKVVYKISDIEKFFANVDVDEVKPGEVYFDIMKAGVVPLLQSVIEGAVVTVMVQYSIDDAILSMDTIRRHVDRLVQERLDAIDSGLDVTSVQLVRSEWPKQVDEAFQAFFTASQMSQQAVSEARSYAEETLTGASGRVAEPLYEALMSEGDVNDVVMEQLWSQVAGEAQDTIAQARAYRTKVVEAAKANANYLQSILPEYRKRPELVLQRIYLDTIERVLANADEKFIIQPSHDLKGREIRILVNSDPAMKPKGDQEAGVAN